MIKNADFIQHRSKLKGGYFVGHKTKQRKDMKGCNAHDDCFTCPFPDCIQVSKE